MRVAGRFENIKQVNMAVDSLRNIGLDRKDMIISNLAREEKFKSMEDASKEIILTKTERDSIGNYGSYLSTLGELKGDEGIVVSVEASKHMGTRIKDIMNQSGAVEIIED